MFLAVPSFQICGTYYTRNALHMKQKSGLRKVSQLFLGQELSNLHVEINAKINRENLKKLPTRTGCSNVALPETGNQFAMDMKIALSKSTGTLDLSDFGLTKVPDVVWTLSELEDLSLAGNNIENLSPQIGNLKNLRRLGLAGNLLPDLPPEICKLQALEGLWLHGNLLQALPEEIGNLTNLRMFALAGNKLTKLPDSIGNLQNLQVLSAAGNRIRCISPGIGNLTKLRVLALYGNELESVPSSISSLAALQDLWLQGNRITSLPSDLSGLTSVRQFSVADNRLSSVPLSLFHLPSVDTIWLYGNQISSLPTVVGAQQNQLKNLWLESNPLEGESLENLITSLKGVKTIGIDTSQADGLSPSARLSSSLSVGRIAGTPTSAHGGGYFKVQAWKDAMDERSPLLVVAFGSAPGVPNWGGLLRRAREALRNDPSFPGFDTLYVVDPSRSWYSHGPLHEGGANACKNQLHEENSDEGNGFDAKDRQQAVADSHCRQEYYEGELREALRGYKRVLLLGDSMGASAALRFSALSTSVLAFCPQVDLLTASIRPGCSFQWYSQFRDTLLTSVRESNARISVHCGNWSHDVDQAKLVDFPEVELNIHPVNDHRLAKSLDECGELLSIVLEALRKETNGIE